MDMKKKAKCGMLKELSKAMSDDSYSPIADALKGKKMQKVTIASDSPEGLKKGLSKAEELLKLKKSPEPEMDSEESMEEEDEESSEMPEMEEESDEMMSEDMSKEKIMAMIEMLQKKLEQA